MLSNFADAIGSLRSTPGVIYLLPASSRVQQVELFSAALDWIGRTPDLVNTALDVDYKRGEARVRHYSLS